VANISEQIRAFLGNKSIKKRSIGKEMAKKLAKEFNVNYKIFL